jgi:non-ribosomal peptide synthetase component E (peptide arylation enzyme)
LNTLTETASASNTSSNTSRTCPRFKLPDRLVLVTDLPATKVGKIDKKALRADIARRLADDPAHPER